MQCNETEPSGIFVQAQSRINEVLAHMRTYGDAKMKGRDIVVYVFLPKLVHLGQIIVKKYRGDDLIWERIIPFNASDFAALLAQRSEQSSEI